MLLSHFDLHRPQNQLQLLSQAGWVQPPACPCRKQLVSSQPALTRQDVSCPLCYKFKLRKNDIQEESASESNHPGRFWCWKDLPHEPVCEQEV
ncbi:hypothetical protein Q5P01_001724 [Channa striata]|uniref:Uncharacterized protein n=1 Tax=Channa striata TaxID=64152 RepID=A0AA88NLB8_CHASR|nr:hypothetical protein Q5P01_001724 [Channa striata]